MQEKIYYTSGTEREQTIKEKQAAGKYLVEDAITIDDGNYLIFDTVPPEPEPQPPSLDERLEALEMALLELL